MIKSFRSKALKRLYTQGDPSGLRADLVKRILIRLTRLESADRPEDMNATGFNFHALKSFDPKRYTVHVNGPFCITFSWDEGATDVDLENYH